VLRDEELAAIKKRVEAATPGPWAATGEYFCLAAPDATHVVCFGHDYDDYGDVKGPDAEFIAHARTDVPALLAEVERLRAELANLVGAIAQEAERIIAKYP
jgi:hypothetical protein